MKKRIGKIAKVRYTIEEGGLFKNLYVHSVKFPSGERWDAVNGLNKDKNGL